MTHPLTDEMCEKIQLHIFNQTDADCMRSAADWQLEQVIKWLEETECNRYNNVKIIHANDLRAAMRPQEDNQ